MPLETETKNIETETTAFETKTETRSLETETIKNWSRDVETETSLETLTSLKFLGGVIQVVHDLDLDCIFLVTSN